MEKLEPCPGTYHYPVLAQRIEVDTKDKKKSWLITYCSKCNFNYTLEEYHGKVKRMEINTDGLPPPPPGSKPRHWPQI